MAVCDMVLRRALQAERRSLPGSIFFSGGGAGRGAACHLHVELFGILPVETRICGELARLEECDTEVHFERSRAGMKSGCLTIGLRRLGIVAHVKLVET